MTSNTPMSARYPAAVVEDTPWSWAADTKWVWMRPLVESPHMKKLPKSSQNVPLAHASRSAPKAACTGRMRAGGGGGSVAP